MEDLDFTTRPAKSPIYDPGVARACFESLGKVESVARGRNVFLENHKSEGMYLLLEGEVGLARGNKVIDIVRAGEIFGEMGSISELPRSATATARSDCRLVSLGAKQFQNAIQNTPEFALMLMNIMIERLRLTTAIVGNKLVDSESRSERRVFDQKLLRELVDRLDHRQPTHATANQIIMKEGEAGVFMYIVLEGRVAISVKSKVVERIGPGGVFGEMALVNQSPRGATAQAETSSSLLSINRNDFLNLVKTKPAFAVSLLKALADRLRYMTSHRR